MALIAPMDDSSIVRNGNGVASDFAFFLAGVDFFLVFTAVRAGGIEQLCLTVAAVAGAIAHSLLIPAFLNQSLPGQMSG